MTIKNRIKYFCNINSIEQNAISPLISASDMMTEICVFPDIHYCSEKSLPVGVAFLSTDKFFPLVTGKDVGCGVAFLRFSKSKWNKQFDKNIHYRAFDKASQTFTADGLGGGNHFLSIETGDDNNTYIICHTGTRNLGIYMYQQLLKLIADFNFENNTVGDSLPIEYYTDELNTKYNTVLDYGINRRKDFLIKSFEFLVHNNYINSNVDYEIQDSIHNVFRINGNTAIHRKGATELIENDFTGNLSNEIVIPISMTRGSLIVKPKPGISLADNLWSCAHGASRQLSRTDSLKHWHSLKNKEKKEYEKRFVELLDRNGKFSNGYLQEFDFAYKNSDSILSDQPFLKSITNTTPIVTIKFAEI